MERKRCQLETEIIPPLHAWCVVRAPMNWNCPKADFKSALEGTGEVIFALQMLLLLCSNVYVICNVHGSLLCVGNWESNVMLK